MKQPQFDNELAIVVLVIFLVAMFFISCREPFAPREDRPECQMAFRTRIDPDNPRRFIQDTIWIIDADSSCVVPAAR